MVWRWGDGGDGGRVLAWMGRMLLLSRLEMGGVIAGAYKSRGKATLSLVVEHHRGTVRAPLSAVFFILSCHI